MVDALGRVCRVLIVHKRADSFYRKALYFAAACATCSLKLPIFSMLQTDLSLLEAAQRGDRKAQYQLYRNCYSMLMAVCVRYCRQPDDAAALMNAGFLKILTGLSKWRREVPFEAWARRVMINTAIDDYRARERERAHADIRELPDDAHLTDHLTEVNTSEWVFAVEQLEAFIRALAPVTQRVFNLFAIDGYSHDEIGQLLSISIGTSKWHLSDARRRLRDMIEKHKYETHKIA
jgi:RNA polymerase sigma factor (sigma-70 family)